MQTKFVGRLLHRQRWTRWRWVLCRAMVLLLGALGPSSPPVVAGEITVGGRIFRIPEGMELEIVASSPLIDRPITADFDEQGFLYVTESSGSNDNVEQQLAERPHRVLRLEDVDGDGRYDRRTVFADHMMFPEGSLWHNGSLYVSAPPSIWKLTDTDGDGVADQRSEWFAGKTLTGCANDLHGPYLGRDGWIYWCKGAFAEQTYETPGRGIWTTQAAHIFRRHPTESWVEPVMTGGMDNPVDVVFTPSGERLFTTTFLQNPAGGQRDGLIHAVYGGLYGKVHGVIDGHVRTGELMPVMTHLGAAAPAGLTLLESSHFGDEFQGNVVAALFNLHKVTRHILQSHGATFTTGDSDLVATDDLDFHPTDVIEDADGSLMIIDTGGWYKLCCPTSQLWKPDVLGAIYRLRGAGRRSNDPRGTNLDWNDLSVDALAVRLTDPRLAVRRRAVASGVAHPDKALPAVKRLLESNATNATNAADRAQFETRLTCVWLLGRIGSADALNLLLEQMAGEPVAAVRHAALHVIGLWRYKPGLAWAHQQLVDGDPHVRRAAAEAVGRMGDTTSVEPLFAAAGMPTDRVLMHSLAYALIELQEVPAVQPYLRDTNVALQQIAAIALDQMPAGDLKPGDVLPLLTSTEPALRATALSIVERRTNWSAEVAKYLSQQSPGQWGDSPTLQQLLRAFAGADAVQEWMGTQLARREISGDFQRTMLAAMAQSGAETLPAQWGAPLRTIFDDSSSAELVADAAEVLRRVPPATSDYKMWRRVLVRTAQRDTLPIDCRLSVLSALPQQSPITDRLGALTLSHVGTESEVDLRTHAVRALTRYQLTPLQLQSAAARIGIVGPLEIEPYLSIFSQSHDRQIGEALLTNLAESPALTSLTDDVISKHLASFGPEFQQRGIALLASHVPEREAQRERIAQLVKKLESGDIRRGQQVFHGKQAACFTCHAMGYLGGQIGPDLTHIGRTRSAHDLFESVLYPSTSFVRSYEPWTVETKDGRIVSGVLREQNQNQVVLVTTTREEVRIAQGEIDSMQPSKTSIMPTGLDQQLTEQSLLDLITFLLQSK